MTEDESYLFIGTDKGVTQYNVTDGGKVRE